MDTNTQELVADGERMRWYFGAEGRNAASVFNIVINDPHIGEKPFLSVQDWRAAIDQARLKP